MQIRFLPKGLANVSRATVLAAGFATAAHSQSAPDPGGVESAIKQADSAIARIAAVPSGQRTFENTVLAIDDLTDALNTKTAQFVFMEQVSPDSQVRQQAREADERISNWGAALSKREDLFNAVQEYAGRKETLDPMRARLLTMTLRDFRRNGMALTKADRDRLQSMDEQINKATIQFEQNVAEDASTALFTKAELDGVPDKFLRTWKYAEGEYLIPLGEDNYVAIARFANKEETRKKAWLAFKRRGGVKNVEVLKQVIKLRAQEAKLLGFPNTATFELEIRMAKNPAKVQAFYDQLKPIVRKKAILDWAEFLAAKRTLAKDPSATFHQWDQEYVKNYLKKSKYAVDSSKVAEYFPAEQVLTGLFNITQQMYGLAYKDVSAAGDQYGKPLWAPGVKYYEVDDTKTGKAIGHFYLDLYPRPGKYSHAACFGLISRKVEPDGTLQLPLAALVVNVAEKTGAEPALLSHDDVETIFHEFGHCLHNMLTESPISRFSGTNVELDFVEAPSQMFENWVWDPAVLRTFAKHYKTGQPMPEAMLKGMIAARNLGSGLETEHQMYYGLVDQKLYSTPTGDVDPTAVGIETMQNVELYHGVPGTMFEASFDHLMNYDAGYYSYLWSLVYAQDMFQRFKKLGLLSPEAGRYYREHILAKGGTEDADVMLRSFLGRDPTLEPFLEHLGMPGK